MGVHHRTGLMARLRIGPGARPAVACGPTGSPRYACAILLAPSREAIMTLCLCLLALLWGLSTPLDTVAGPYRIVPSATWATVVGSLEEVNEWD